MAETLESNTQETADTGHQDTLGIRYGEDVFTHVCPLSEVALHVSTPTGKSIKCSSKFVGLHSKHLLLFEMPKLSPNALATYFQRGYVIRACVISGLGDAQKIYFKSKVEYVIQAGDVAMFLVSVPTSAQIAGGLRSEARLQITLDGTVDPHGRCLPCMLKDISPSGCLLQIERQFADYKIGQQLQFSLSNPTSESDENEHESQDQKILLSATVMNQKQGTHSVKYGMKFSQGARKAMENVITKIEFCRETQRFLI